ncbi:glycosyltransferase family 39 protein [Halovenus halobia]|uniref:glycosyltransferase family 39 protein n=1 Tax=Halovenus halobia TaxID=3396622 RepID=UPI003F556FAA
MTDTERVEQATRSYLDDYPEHEDTLEQLHAHEQDEESWAFDDTDLDSGTFGELVSRPFVENAPDGDYHFADRQAVRAVLHGTEEDTSTTDRELDLDIALPAVDRRALVGLVGTLAVLVAARSLFFGQVFVNGRVVSPANDSYFFRYWQAELLARSSGAFDFGMLSTIGELTRIRPMSHALNWWLAELSGAPDLVAAFAPVLASVILGLAVYGIARTLTGDRRIALAAVLTLALTPVHVTYTALGFLDHGPYQYLWIGVIVYTLVWLAVDVQKHQQSGTDNPAWKHVQTPRAWAVAGLLALGTGALAHTWGGSPLSFVPIGAYFAGRVVTDTEAGVDPFVGNLPALTGVVVGSLFALGAHLRWGWHESIAATVPVAVAVGVVTLAVLAHLWQRVDLPALGLLGAEGVLGVVGIVLFRRLRPEDVARLQERSDAFFNRETATETASLFRLDQAIVFGPLSQLGLGFYFALVPLLVLTYYVVRRYEPGWLAAVAFAWYYLAIATFQVRFAAKFAVLCAVFAGVGLVYLLSAVDLARPVTIFDREPPEGPSLSLPETPTIGAYLVGAVGLIFLLNLIFVPSLLSQIQYSDEQIGAMESVDERVEELNQSYPDNFVLSEWGENRMYNHFVNGESRGYGYARGTYEPFISDSNPDSYFNNFNNRVGYVVLTDVDAPEGTIQDTLFEDFGAGNDSVAHYQLIYSESNVRAFAVVDGAVVRTQAEPGTNVTVTRTIQTAGEQFEYRRTATANNNGIANIRVAYPGDYTVGGQTVSVNETQVNNGATVRAGN